jgi:hypothetical protein
VVIPQDDSPAIVAVVSGEIVVTIVAVVEAGTIGNVVTAGSIVMVVTGVIGVTFVTPGDDEVQPAAKRVRASITVMAERARVWDFMNHISWYYKRST